MNSWSSIPNEYVVWFVIVTKRLPMAACSCIARRRSSIESEYHSRFFTNG